MSRFLRWARRPFLSSSKARWALKINANFAFGLLKKLVLFFSYFRQALIALQRMRCVELLAKV
jgi:hypothetical protein